jgi:chromosome segregation ATPase
MRSVEELEALLEVAIRERDEARAEVGMLEDRLSESRAEVDRLTDERDELLVRVEDQGAELRATREAYNEARAELTRERIGIRPIDEVRSDAYRRGAEAMREACADCVKHLSHEDGLGMGSQRLEGAIRALPIPEEP